MTNTSRNSIVLRLAKQLSLVGVAVVLTGLGANYSDASITVPELPEFTLNDSVDTHAGDSDDSLANQLSQRSQRDEDSDSDPIGEVLFGGHSSTVPASSSSSSTNAGGASYSLAIFGIPTPSHAASELSGWIRGQQSLYLPMPIANELLRPPQLS